MKSKLLKGLALLSFIILVSTFLLYSAGYFDVYVNRSGSYPNLPDNSIPQGVQDSSAAAGDTQIDSLPHRLPSTKVVLIPIDKFTSREKGRIRTDTIKKDNEIRMMSSSKSGRIFDAPAFDSLLRKLDSPQIEKKKNE